jgi:hypothetical protein
MILCYPFLRCRMTKRPTHKIIGVPEIPTLLADKMELSSSESQEEISQLSQQRPLFSQMYFRL